MSQVNLLPPELRQRQVVRRRTSLVVAAGLGVLALIGVFYFLQMQRLADTQDQLAEQQDRNSALQAQIDELRPFADLQAELAEKEALVATLFVNEVSWSGALLDVSRVIPDASYLTNLTAQLQLAAAPTEPVTPTEPGGLIGTMTFTGQALQTETLASWLTRLEQVEGWVNAWVTNATETGPFSDRYNFTSGLDLTTDALTERGRGEVAP